MLWLKKYYWVYRKKREAHKKRVWQKKNNPQGISYPVFLAGCYRSGTTILSKTLAESLEIDFYSDGNNTAFNKWYLRDFYSIQKLVERSYSRVMLFQVNNELYRIHHLLEQYPNSKSIIIFRDYKDVVNSTMRNKWKWVKGQVLYNLKLFHNLFYKRYKRYFELIEVNYDSPLVLLPGETTKYTNYLSPIETREGEASCYALHWLLCAKLVLDSGLSKNESVVFVDYHALVHNPQNEVLKICDFLDIAYEDNFINKIHSKSVRKHKPTTISEDIERECQKTYQELLQLTRK